MDPPSFQPAKDNTRDVDTVEQFDPSHDIGSFWPRGKIGEENQLR